MINHRLFFTILLCSYFSAHISFVYASKHSEPLFNTIVYQEYSYIVVLENEMKRLIAKGCDINWVKDDYDEYKKTALSAIIARRHWDTIPDQTKNKVRTLLQYGAKPHVEGQSFASLSLAVRTEVLFGKEWVKVYYPDLEMIDMLYKAGADINGNLDRCSSLFYAVNTMIGKESIQALEYLLDHGAKTDVVLRKDGCNLISYMIQESTNLSNSCFSTFSESNAAQQRTYICNAIDLLCKHGVTIEHKDIDGKTALDYAQKNNDPIIIKHLKKYTPH